MHLGYLNIACTYAAMSTIYILMGSSIVFGSSFLLVGVIRQRLDLTKFWIRLTAVAFLLCLVGQAQKMSTCVSEDFEFNTKLFLFSDILHISKDSSFKNIFSGKSVF